MAARRRSLPNSFQLSLTSRTGPVAWLGPFSQLYFHGEDLCDAVGGRLIARHIGHDWVVDGEHYLRMDCAARLQVAFLDDSNQVGAKSGPYLHFSTMDGIAFGNHEVLAHIDARTKLWFVLQDGTEWPAVLVTPVA